jgi:hypothetical protein
MSAGGPGGIIGGAGGVSQPFIQLLHNDFP